MIVSPFSIFASTILMICNLVILNVVLKDYGEIQALGRQSLFYACAGLVTLVFSPKSSI